MLRENFEQSRCAHAAADAHRHDAVFRAAPLAFDQQVAGHARARHAVRVADGDRAARHVELVVRNAEFVADVEHLAGECFVELPDADIVHRQAVLLQELRHGEHRADAHLVRIARRDHHAAVDAERLEAALFRFLRFHQHQRRRAVRQLRGVAGGDEASFLDALAALEHRRQRLQVGERRLRPIAFVELERDFLLRGRARFLVGERHDRSERRHLGVVAPFGLRLRGALLRLQRILILRLAAHAVALGDDLRGLDHGHVDLRQVLHQPRIGGAEAIHLVVLHERDRLDAAADGDLHAVVDDLLRSGRDRHQSGGALPVDRHARHRHRKPGAQQALARDVAAGRALLHGAADHDVLDLSGADARALHGLRERVADQLLALSVVECAAIGLADRRARGGDDDCFTHEIPRYESISNPGSACLPPPSARAAATA
jgi:hypothetical protein